MQGMIDIRAAIIGLGRVGFSFGLDLRRVQPASHLACLSALPHQISKIAVCDSDPDKLALASDTIKDTGKAVYSNVSEMMREFKPDFVLIATPTPTHYDIVMNVASYSCVKAIFLEKPIAQSLIEADQIIAACKRNGIKLTVNHTRRWDPIYTNLQKNFNMKSPFSMIGIHPGPILRTGIHMIDLFNFVLGVPKQVQAFGCHWSNYLEGDDININGALLYGNCEATLISGHSVDKLVLFELDMRWDDSRIRITENGGQSHAYIVLPSQRYTGLKEYRLSQSINHYETETPLLCAIREMCNSEINSCTGEDARLALQVALALHYSSKHDNKLISLKDVPCNYTVESM